MLRRIRPLLLPVLALLLAVLRLRDDLALVQTIALIVATVYVGVNLTADVLTLLANPRLRTAATRSA